MTDNELKQQLYREVRIIHIMATVSVIIPIYNVEKYLKTCLDSVLNQTYKDLEIILIDDGSPDKCPYICDEYAEKDNRVTVIHQENKGCALARNLGLDVCTGQYISFVDSDDSLELFCIEMLYKALMKNRLDICSCNYGNYDEEYRFIKPSNFKYSDFIVDGIEAQKRIWYTECINLSPWGKLYDKALWDDVRFVNCSPYDDYATMHMIYTKAKRFGYTSVAGYRYVLRKGSGVRSFTPQKLVTLDTAENTIRYCKEENESLIPAAICKAVSTHFHIFMQLDDKYGECAKRINRFIAKNRCAVLRDSRSSLKVKLACLSSYFGLSFVKMVFRLTIARSKVSGAL